MDGWGWGGGGREADGWKKKVAMYVVCTVVGAELNKNAYYPIKKKNLPVLYNTEKNARARTRDILQSFCKTRFSKK